MRNFLLLLSFCSITSLEVFAQAPIHYKQPARNWNEASPVGNGRLGVMTFGRVEEELLQLNEETLWSGGPVEKNPNPDAIKHLPAVRAALSVRAMKRLQKNYKKYRDSIPKLINRWAICYLNSLSMPHQRPIFEIWTSKMRRLIPNLR